VGLATRLVGFRNPIVFASIPSFAGVVARMHHTGLIYYYSDKYDSYRDITARESIVARDRQLFESSDAVFCASEAIYADLVGDRDHVHLLPHAVDFRHFNAVVDEDVLEPADLSAVPHPRVGYFGSITSSNDQEMIRVAAERAPDLHFVMIGRVLGNYSVLKTLPNVHFLGFKPYADLPRYGKYFDAAFMSWIMTDWIRHSNPLKTKEYLSMGLPVVSVRIEQLEREFADVVLFADDGEQFINQVRKALAEDSPEARAQRIKAVRGESWDARAAEMMDKFEVARGNKGHV
jgi:glycosyltransferase involved in cell wall biosynthesis